MIKKSNRLFFPVLVNLNKYRCLVIGGGEVACRKVLSLLEFNANITVLSPRFCKPLVDLSKQNKIKIIPKAYSKEYLKNFGIVFCATDNETINKTVYQDCDKENILINTADNPALCDFILPANIKRGNLTISVSSQGTAPFYTKAIKEKIENLFTPVYTDIIKLAGEFRSQLLKNAELRKTKNKAKLFNRFISINWENTLKENGKKSSRFYILKIFKELN